MLPKCCLCPVQKRNQPIKDISCKTVCGFHLLDDHCPFTRRGCNVPGATEEEAEAHCWERHRQEAWRWIWSWASETWKWGQGEPCVGLAGQDPQSVEAASSCCRQQLCSLSDPPYALPPIPKDGKGIIILREHCAKIFFFFLEFLERLLDSSKYSFKSHWSICYSATVIAAGGGRFLTRCTHARTRRPGTAIFQCQGRAAPAVWSLYLIIWSWGLWLILLRASKTTPPPLLVYYL